jgi:hypothetical protein
VAGGDFVTEYTDPKNRRHRIIQSVYPRKESQSELENEILKELYRIFMKKPTFIK